MSVLIKQVIASRYLVWLALSVPALEFVWEFLFPGRYYPEMMQQSGVLSVQLLVFTLAITPVSLVLKHWFGLGRFSLWLLRNRRYFGVASFGYAGIHTLLYLRQISFDLELAWLEALDWPFGTGWIALIVMAIPAFTSNNWTVRKFGTFWKPLQRLVYFVAIVAFAHWLLIDFFIDDAMQWIVLLLMAKIIHVFIRYKNFLIKKNFNAGST